MHEWKIMLSVIWVLWVLPSTASIDIRSCCHNLAQKSLSAIAQAHCTKKKAVCHAPLCYVASLKWTGWLPTCFNAKQEAEICEHFRSDKDFLMTWSQHPHTKNSDIYFLKWWQSQSNISPQWLQALWRKSGSLWSRKQYCQAGIIIISYFSFSLGFFLIFKRFWLYFAFTLGQS